MKAFGVLVFDLLVGPFLDPVLLSGGIRKVSMRRVVIAAMAAPVAARLWEWSATEPPAWPLVVLVVALVFSLDVQGAIRDAPEAALRAIGGIAGRGVGALQSSYSAARSWVAPASSVDNRFTDDESGS